MTIIHKYISLLTIGEILLLSNGKVLTGVFFLGHKGLPKIIGNLKDAEIFSIAYAELTDYIKGNRQQFTVPYYLKGTDFQLKVWREITKIPFGNITNYQNIANLISQPTAVRAVANAISRNPMSIIVPCHRIIGLDSSLKGYAGGLQLKSIFLELEKTF